MALRAAGGLVLLLGGLLLPRERLLPLLGELPLEERPLALSVLSLCLVLNGLALLFLARFGRAFEGPGLPAELLGLRGGAVEGHEPARLAWLATIVAVGLAVRIPGLSGDLWIDEIATLVNYLRLPIAGVVQAYSSANQHLLYSVLGSAGVAVFGESAAAIRAPALLFGVAGLFALHRLGRWLAPEREALLATALLAVSYHHVWFSQSARGYTAMVFFATAGTALFVEGLARNRSAPWRLYVACMSLGVLSLQNTAFVVLGHAASYVLLLLHARRFDLLRSPLSGRLASSLLLVALLSVTGHSLVLPRMLHFFRTVDRTGLGFGLSDFWPVLLGGLRAGLGVLGLLGLAAVLAAGLKSYLRQSPLLAGLLVLPGLFNAAALVALRYGAYPRSFLYVLPVALLLAVRGTAVLGAAACRRAQDADAQGSCARRAQALAAGLLLAASGLALLQNLRHPKQDYTGALRFVRQRAAPGDEVAAVGLAAVAYKLLYAPDLRFPGGARELTALPAAGRTVWVLFSFPRDMRLRFPEILDALDAHFTTVARFRGTLGDGDIYVARSKP